MSNEKYEYDDHAPIKIKGIQWVVCRKCGLIYLKNEFTDWCIKKGCNNEDHPDYNHVRLKLTKND